MLLEHCKLRVDLRALPSQFCYSICFYRCERERGSAEEGAERDAASSSSSCHAAASRWALHARRAAASFFESAGRAQRERLPASVVPPTLITASQSQPADAQAHPPHFGLRRVRDRTSQWKPFTRGPGPLIREGGPRGAATKTRHEEPNLPSWQPLWHQCVQLERQSTHAYSAYHLQQVRQAHRAKTRAVQRRAQSKKPLR